MANTLYVLNVPNLDLPGNGEPGIVGRGTLCDVEELCGRTAASHGLRADCRRCDGEAELIDLIHQAQAKQAVGIIINAGACSHHSMALHNALVAAEIPAVEVRVSNVHAHENFRHHSFTAKAAIASLSGFGIDGYRLAITGLAAKIGAKAAA